MHAHLDPGEARRGEPGVCGRVVTCNVNNEIYIDLHQPQGSLKWEMPVEWISAKPLIVQWRGCNLQGIPPSSSHRGSGCVCVGMVCCTTCFPSHALFSKMLNAIVINIRANGAFISLKHFFLAALGWLACDKGSTESSS